MVNISSVSEESGVTPGCDLVNISIAALAIGLCRLQSRHPTPSDAPELFEFCKYDQDELVLLYLFNMLPRGKLKTIAKCLQRSRGRHCWSPSAALQTLQQQTCGSATGESCAMGS